MNTTEQLERELDENTFPLHRYKPIEKLGHGTSGRAFLAFDDFMDQDVVVKTMAAIDLEHIIEFQRDAGKLCRLSSKYLAQVIDFGCTNGGIAYIVSEFQPGTNLAKHITEFEPLPPELAIKTFIAVAEALALMHSNGILHRDVRTSNILVRSLDTGDASIYLIDAGTGRVKIATIDPLEHEGRRIPGDPKYMAPEFVMQHYDARSEVYTLGCTMFESLTGRTPFDGPDALSMLVRRSAPSLSQVAAGISYPHALEEFLSKCLAKSPEARFQTMQEVVYKLRDLSKLRLQVNRQERPKRDAKPNYTVDRSTKPPTEKNLSITNEDGDKVVLRFEEEQSVRLVDADVLDAKPTASEPKKKTDTAGGEDDILSLPDKQKPSTDSTPDTKRSQRKQASKEAYEAWKQSQTNARVSEKSGSTAKAKPTDVKEKEPAIDLNADGSEAQGALTPTQDDPEADDDLSARTKQLLSASVNWAKTSRYRFVALAAVFIMLLCGSIFVSYLSFLLAPTVDIKGPIYGYSPATDSKPGYIEVGTNGLKGYTEIVRVLIETPEQNLPRMFAQNATVSTDSTSWGPDLFDAAKVDLNHLANTKKPLQSDLRIGEFYELSCRKQFDGKTFLEEIKNGRLPVAHQQIEDIHLTISTMFQKLAEQSGKPEYSNSWVTDEWATSALRSEVNFSPPPPGTFVPKLFPAQDMKLVDFEVNRCWMMLKTPPWFKQDGSNYIMIELIRGPLWRIHKIQNCSEHDWNRA